MHSYTQVLNSNYNIEKTCVTLKFVTHAHRVVVAKTIVVHFFHLLVALLYHAEYMLSTFFTVFCKKSIYFFALHNFPIIRDTDIRNGYGKSNGIF